MRGARRLHQLRFFVADAWDEWRHSPGVNLLAVGTLTSALFLAALFALVLHNVGARVERLRGDVRLEIYLEADITAEQIAALRAEVEALPSVERVEYIDKAEALRRYRAWARDLAGLIEELEENPLPTSFEVFLADGRDKEQAGERVAALAAGRPGVEEVRFDRDWIRRLESLLELARLGGLGLGVVVFAAVAFVMASVLRLAAYSRRDEIDIMLLVGASPAFVRGPFLVSGLAQGLLSAALALGLVEGLRRLVAMRVGSGSLALVDLVAADPISWRLSAALALIGLAVSLVSSWFAVRRS